MNQLETHPLRVSERDVEQTPGYPDEASRKLNTHLLTEFAERSLRQLGASSGLLGRPGSFLQVGVWYTSGPSRDVMAI